MLLHLCTRFCVFVLLKHLNTQQALTAIFILADPEANKSTSEAVGQQSPNQSVTLDLITPRALLTDQGNILCSQWRQNHSLTLKQLYKGISKRERESQRHS